MCCGGQWEDEEGDPAWYVLTEGGLTPTVRRVR